MSMMNLTIQSQSEEETISFAQKLAKELKAGDVLLLYGDLGMGKTVFSRALVRALCGDEVLEVPSPTFTLVQSYDSAVATIWHFDLYRLCDSSEVYEIGWEEALSGDEGIALVEWPERLDDMLPAGAMHVHISAVQGQPDARLIEVSRESESE